jgi:GntR family transcriptional repressor for pyruvate dehydrogenase complex
MGVSRGTLREALNQLELMGIIEMRQGSGTYVRSITPSSFMESLSPALSMDRSSAGELLDARLYIEGAVAYLAAKKATDGEIWELKNILAQMRKALRKTTSKILSTRMWSFMSPSQRVRRTVC